MKSFITTVFGNSIRIGAGLILAILLLFTFQNWDVLKSGIELKFVGSVEKPLWIWFIVLFGLGNLCWYIFTFKTKRTLKKAVSQQKQQLKDLQGELSKLRNSSLTDEIKQIDSISPPTSGNDSIKE